MRSTPPGELLEAALRGLLAHHGREPGSRALATLLRSVGSGDEIGSAVRSVSDDYARVLASLSSADNRALRADLALSWMLGIGMMRVVVGKEPLADADPDEVCALVMVALGTLLDGLPETPARGSVNAETSAL